MGDRGGSLAGSPLAPRNDPRPPRAAALTFLSALEGGLAALARLARPWMRDAGTDSGT